MCSTEDEPGSGYMLIWTQTWISKCSGSIAFTNKICPSICPPGYFSREEKSVDAEDYTQMLISVCIYVCVIATPKTTSSASQWKNG